jgi:uncharacterized DUF497 family protein
MKYEWDKAKNAANIEKRGIDFSDAHELFEGNRLVFTDDRKDYGESRFITVGYIENRMMVAAYTQRSSGTIRIISLRKANSREKARFGKTIKN